MVSSAAAVGGGSIIYGNTLYQPLEPFYRDKQWAHITDWKAELALLRPGQADARRAPQPAPDAG
jgi:hypothetical protein